MNAFRCEFIEFIEFNSLNPLSRSIESIEAIHSILSLSLSSASSSFACKLLAAYYDPLEVFASPLDEPIGQVEHQRASPVRHL